MSGNEIAGARVVAVLLADGWHRIVPGSFSVGTLRFEAEADPGTLGFRFEEEADPASPYRPAVVAGPLDSLLAVRQVPAAGRQTRDLARPAARPWARTPSEAVA